MKISCSSMKIFCAALYLPPSGPLIVQLRSPVSYWLLSSRIVRSSAFLFFVHASLSRLFQMPSCRTWPCFYPLRVVGINESPTLIVLNKAACFCRKRNASYTVVSESYFAYGSGGETSRYTSCLFTAMTRPLLGKSETGLVSSSLPRG